MYVNFYLIAIDIISFIKIKTNKMSEITQCCNIKRLTL